MLGAKPTATPAELKAALRESAVEVEASDPCSAGAGLVEAVGAIEALLAPPLLTPLPCLTPASEGSADEARAPGDWGSEIPASPPVVVSPPAPTTPVTTEFPRPRPRTFILNKPGRVIRTHGRSARVVLRFGSNQADVFYACRIDGGFFRPCPERLARRFSLGSHAVLVAAHDAAGNGDRTPAAFRFKVKRVG
jgi:hypothetical protein